MKQEERGLGPKTDDMRDTEIESKFVRCSLVPNPLPDHL
jgi:hypothetical protein